MPVIVFPLNIRTPQELSAAIARIEADPRSNAYFQPKRRTRHFYIKHADFRAAAYMKQELLARGGDAVVGKHVIDAQVSFSDILLIGTDGQLAALAQKMEAMDCWGLAALRDALRDALKKISQAAWVLSLPGGRELVLDARTKIMGILNLTDDSFYAASRVADTNDLLRRAGRMLEDGADVLDLGAESTRPGSTPLDEEEELARLIPALTALRKSFPQAVLSADTYKGKVALRAADAGADIINDISGFTLDPDMSACAAQTGLPFVLSHIRGRPEDMQHVPVGEDLLGEINLYFQDKISEAEAAGFSADRLILDPGLGFGKRGEDNLILVKEAESLSVFGRPLLFGHSRKKFTGTATGAEDSGERLPGTIAVSALLEGRVQMIRVHDVKENRQALAMARAVREASPWRS